VKLFISYRVILFRKKNHHFVKGNNFWNSLCNYNWYGCLNDQLSYIQWDLSIKIKIKEKSATHGSWTRDPMIQKIWIHAHAPLSHSLYYVLMSQHKYLTIVLIYGPERKKKRPQKSWGPELWACLHLLRAGPGGYILKE
jgi:hypothetical protein